MTNPNTLNIISMAVGPLHCNCSIVYDPQSRDGVVIDPGGNTAQIMSHIEREKLNIVAILHTHGHTDHILASGEIKQATGAPLWLHPADKPLWDNLEKQCYLFGIPYTPVPEPDHWLDESQPLSFAQGKVLHTPGHSPGSCCFYFAESELLIAGDTLFCGSIGRTDLFGGSFEDISSSIRNKVYPLPDSVRIITGHGIDTTVAYEKQHNPFVRP